MSWIGREHLDAAVEGKVWNAPLSSSSHMAFSGRSRVRCEDATLSAPVGGRDDDDFMYRYAMNRLFF